MSVLLDTNILSELARPSPQESVIDYCRRIESAYISVITLHELVYGAKLVEAKSKQKKLLVWIESIQNQYEHNSPNTQKVAKLNKLKDPDLQESISRHLAFFRS